MKDQGMCEHCYISRSEECAVSGRRPSHSKGRDSREPPQLENLLVQSREQTDRIRELMAELEEANRKVEEARTGASNALSPTADDSVTLMSSAAEPEIERDGHDLIGSTDTHADCHGQSHQRP